MLWNSCFTGINFEEERQRKANVLPKMQKLWKIRYYHNFLQRKVEDVAMISHLIVFCPISILLISNSNIFGVVIMELLSLLRILSEFPVSSGVFGESGAGRELDMDHMAWGGVPTMCTAEPWTGTGDSRWTGDLSPSRMTGASPPPPLC